MNFVVYILWSKSDDKIYTGFTENLIQRIYWHNHGPKGHTVRYRPWQVIHVEFYNEKKVALTREKALKGGQGRLWIKKNFKKDRGFISA